MTVDPHRSAIDSRLQSLQAYRALAALGVVLLHINEKFAAPHYFGSRTWGAFSIGWLGVDFFFVLSGFIIAESMRRRPSPGLFFYHRFIRIYPPFWLAFIATLPVALYANASLHTPVPTDWRTLLQAALLIPQAGAAPVISVAWTLHHELLFYVLAGLFLLNAWVALAASAVVLAGSFFNSQVFPADFLFSPLHWEFLAGIIVSFSWRRLNPGPARCLLGGGIALMIAMALVFNHWPWIRQSGGLRVLMFAPALAMVVAASAVLETANPHKFRSRVWTLASKFGDSSYTLYLWHISIATVLTKVFLKMGNGASEPTILFANILIALLTAVVAHGIYLWIERPLVRLLKRSIGGRFFVVRPAVTAAEGSSR